MRKVLMVALVFAGVLLSGCMFDRSAFQEDPAIKEVSVAALHFEAASTDDLKVVLAEHCNVTCINMEYQFVDTKYTVYEEGGMYVARDPKCICYDPYYGRTETGFG